MYDKWLLLFHSTKNSIRIKKKEYSIVKEYTENGNMKISVKEPSDWYVILPPEIYKSIQSIEYDIQKQKENIIYKINKIVDTNDIKKIEEVEKEFTKIQEYSKNIQDIVSTKNIDIIDDKIYTIKNTIYNNPKNISNIIALEELLVEKKNSIHDYYNTQKYIIKDKNIIQKGNVPEPPSIDYLQRKKYSDKKIFRAYNEESNSLSGGFTKVVKIE